jgi:hypothetical protein
MKQRTMDSISLDHGVFERVRFALGQVDGRILRRELAPGMSLIDDLGIDSIRFVALALELEDALGIENFPIQSWADGEYSRTGKRFTLASLVERCTTCLREKATPVA